MTTDELDGWDWQAHTVRRETGLVEHVCPHNIGHPNPGSMLWLAEQRIIAQGRDPDGWEILPLEEVEASLGVHGCDGCCSHPSFPGYRDALVHAHRLFRAVQAREQRLTVAASTVLLAVDLGEIPPAPQFAYLEEALGGQPEPDGEVWPAPPEATE